MLNRVLPVPAQVASRQCVEVELFARYPLKKITAEKSTTAVKPGVLNGRYRVTFTELVTTLRLSATVRRPY
ncbi:hypothetical protein ACLB1T_33170 [Escherichia coli]